MRASTCPNLRRRYADLGTDAGDARRYASHRIGRGRGFAPYGANRFESRMMLALAPRPTAVYLCVGPTDMRKGFDGLMRVAAEQATRDVLQGGLFVFVNRRRDRVKLLWWDEDGLAIWYKRLEAGTFELPRVNDEASHIVLSAADLGLLLGGIDLASVRRRKRYRRTA